MTEKEKQEYELALKEGKRRFGSPCNHERVYKGRCLSCFRQISEKIKIIGN